MKTAIPIVLVSLVVLLAGCPKELAGTTRDEWRKVDAGPTLTRPKVDPALQERFRREVAEKRVKKMQAALTTDDERVCKADADCTLTPFHCCPCEQNGALVGVNRTAIPTIVQRRAAVCPEYACAQVVSEDPTCAATRAVCRKGKCVPDVPEGAAAPGGVGVEQIKDDVADGAKAP